MATLKSLNESSVRAILDKLFLIAENVTELTTDATNLLFLYQKYPPPDPRKNGNITLCEEQVKTHAKFQNSTSTKVFFFQGQTIITPEYKPVNDIAVNMIGKVMFYYKLSLNA